MFTVRIRGLDLYGFHGVPDAEQEVGHRYSVDLDLLVEGDATLTDDLNGTVDYAAVAVLVSRLFAAKSYRTVERLGAVVAEAILAEFGAVQEVTITVSKPLPPAPIIVQSVGVALTLKR